MSTRGAIGFTIDGKNKIAFNHFDSYPDGLGLDVLKECQDLIQNAKTFDTHKNIRKLKLVKENSRPTKAQILEYSQYANLSVSTGDIKEWYCLLREIQGKLEPYISGNVKHMIDASDFICDSLFCEWAYIVNLDTDKLEVYKGFQKSPDNSNRFGKKCRDGYYPCKMIKEYDLKNLPTKTEFLKEIESSIEE